MRISPSSDVFERKVATRTDHKEVKEYSDEDDALGREAAPADSPRLAGLDVPVECYRSPVRLGTAQRRGDASPAYRCKEVPQAEKGDEAAEDSDHRFGV